MAESQVLVIVFYLQDRTGCSIRGGVASNARSDMLFYSIFQSFRCASLVARIIMERKLIDNGTHLCGRNAIVLNERMKVLGS